MQQCIGDVRMCVNSYRTEHAKIPRVGATQHILSVGHVEKTESPHENTGTLPIQRVGTTSWLSRETQRKSNEHKLVSAREIPRDCYS